MDESKWWIIFVRLKTDRSKIKIKESFSSSFFFFVEIGNKKEKERKKKKNDELFTQKKKKNFERNGEVMQVQLLSRKSINVIPVVIILLACSRVVAPSSTTSGFVDVRERGKYR